MMKPSIYNLTLNDLIAVCEEVGQPAYRAKQVWQWLYVHFVSDWSQMKNCPKTLLLALGERFSLPSVKALQIEGPEGATRKILVGLDDQECVEEVLLPAGDRNTVCVSSQVGCKFGCAFCASGKGGYLRDLSAGEIVGQAILASQTFGKRPENVVFMGMGEPFDNYDEVLKAVRILNDQDGLCIGARKITLSTSGVIPGIQRLSDEGIQVELSVSLHAPDESLRSRLMPVNKKYPLNDLMTACRAYTEKTHRIITFEYTLIKGQNDSQQHAEQLVRLLQGLQCRVNLIPLSPVEEFNGETPARATAEQFIRILSRHHINATLRDSKGSSVKAACGQLRRRVAAR
jgi:23S rRNA (adenine2503-C2)-methyltransferase